MVNKIIVIGAGPAGMMAAIRSRQTGGDVILLEKNPSPGKKLLLTGKGRCNLTNAGTMDSFFPRYSSRAEFLRDAFLKFSNKELISFLQKNGLSVKVERQARVFPVTDRAKDVVGLFKKMLRAYGVAVFYNAKVEGIKWAETGEWTVLSQIAKNIKNFKGTQVILTTGGLAYPGTGSTGDGLRMAQSLGHRIIGCRPGLVPLETYQDYPRHLEGSTLKNVRLKFLKGKKKIVSDIGELLFTRDGISGPLVISLSRKVVDWLEDKKDPCVRVCVDLKPALSAEMLDKRLCQDIQASPGKTMKNFLKGYLPQRFIAVLLTAVAVSGEKKAAALTQPERKKLIQGLKAFSFDVKRAKGFERSMVTMGGISLKEIDPRTMRSRLVPGLYFAGEIIDIDGDTGGYNLQAAFSTGYLAGESAAKSDKSINTI